METANDEAELLKPPHKYSIVVVIGFYTNFTNPPKKQYYHPCQ